MMWSWEWWLRQTSILSCQRIILSSRPRLTEQDPGQAQVRITDIKLRLGLLFPPSPQSWLLHNCCCCRKLARIVAAADWQLEPTWIQIQVIMLVPHFITSLLSWFLITFYLYLGIMNVHIPTQKWWTRKAQMMGDNLKLLTGGKVCRQL